MHGGIPVDTCTIQLEGKMIQTYFHPADASWWAAPVASLVAAFGGGLLGVISLQKAKVLGAKA
jgi:hypothetical protein